MESQTDSPSAKVQSDYDKLRRLPYFYGFSVLTSTAVLCTVQAPLALFAAELGLGEDQIGLLGGIMPAFQVLGVAALPLVMAIGSRRMAAFSLLARYSFLALFLIAPLYAADPQAAFLLLLTGMVGFSLMRTLAEAALVPWTQEIMPRSVRGKTFGRLALAYLPVALIASWFIQLWLDSQTGLDRFYPVFVVGIAVGILGALSLFGLGGGAPRKARGGSGNRQSLLEPLKDRNFLIYLYSSGTQFLVFMAINLFMLLYFRQRLGMSSGQLVLMAALTPVGAALGSVAAGWFVDRYGTRAIRIALQIGQIILLLAMPFIHPDLPALDVVVAAVFLFFGILFQAGISVTNIYMLNVVPPDSKESYMSLHYSIDGLVAGGVTFAAGFLLAWLADNPIVLFGNTLGNFEVLFVLAALISASSALAFAMLREEGAISVRDFVGLLSTGSPIRALWGIRQYASRTSEERRRDLAYGFGSSGSPLAKEELIEALRDPSFDVRHEAIRSLGHMGSSKEVIEALESVLDYEGLVELQYAALASLGRAKALQSAGKIAVFLDNDNPLLRARAVRALGEIGDMAALPRIQAMLQSDPELDCRLAAVSALGKLKSRDSMPGLIAIYLEQATNLGDPMAEPRSKVVLLAMAKILSVEESFSRQWRREEKNPGHVLPGLFNQLAGLVRQSERNSEDARRLKAFASEARADDAARSLEVLVSLRPRIAASPHADAPLLRGLIDGVSVLETPHPALIILLAVAAGRVLRA